MPRIAETLEEAIQQLTDEKAAHRSTKLRAADHAGEVAGLLWTVRGELSTEQATHRATTGEAEAARRDTATLRAQVTPKRLSKGQLPDDGARVFAWHDDEWRPVMYRTWYNTPGWDLWHSMPDDPRDERDAEIAQLKAQLAALEDSI